MDHLPSKAYIQIQDITGNWISVSTVVNQPQMVKSNVDSTAKQYKKLTRAVDEKGNILQLSQ